MRRAIIGILLGVFLLASHGLATGAESPAHFSELEKRVIREFCSAHKGTASACREDAPERAGKHKHKRKSLPPGIARNLQRGKPLPPGIAKQVLPADLEDQLPDRDGYERLIVDGRVILVDAATRIVRDILEDVLLPD